MYLLNAFTQFLADSFCQGSRRKLIAGWWYTILAISFFLILMTFYIVPTRDSAEAFSTCWSSLTLVCLCVGGTMVMRKFHNSFSTGLFLGGVVGAAQYFFLMFLIYVGFAIERSNRGYKNTFQDLLESGICLTHSILLGSFAVMLGAHRSEIIDRSSTTNESRRSSKERKTAEDHESSYDPPVVT